MGKKICCGCLNNGRRMVEISEIRLRKTFSEIINENQISFTQLLQLCFECASLLLKFANFKLQVAASYKSFQNFNEQKTKPITRLRLEQQINIDVSLPALSDVSAEIDYFKTEIEIDDVTNYNDTLTESIVDEFKSETDIEDEANCNNMVTDSIVDDFKTESDIYDVEDDVYTDQQNAELANQVDLLVEQTKMKKKKKLMDEIEKFIIVKLSGKEIEQEREMLALRDDYVNAMFTCNKCILTFPNEDDLNDHVQVKHDLNASSYKCTICQCAFSSEVSFNYHTNKHTRRYQCTACADRFQNVRAATKHYSVMHSHGAVNDIHFDSTIAGKHCEDNDESAQEKSSFPCQFCAKIFKWSSSLRKHLEKHRIETGEKRKPYCTPCRLSFTTTPNLQKHVRTSSKHKIQLKLRKLNENEFDDVSTTQKQSKQKMKMMDELKSTVTKSQPKYFCQQCEKVFLWRGNLIRHMQSHAAKAKGDLVCKPCNRTFSSIATYQQHMKISKKHVSEDDFKYMCSDCGKRFPTKQHLRDHINWEHLKNFVYTCDQCQKVFKTSNSVYLHRQAVHKKDLEHLCDHCGKSFPNNAKLRSHILAIHSGGVLHQCSLCEARFSWQSCLSRHVRQKHRKLADQVLPASHQ